MPKTVLVLHGGALGDCVLAIHFARALRVPDTFVVVAARSSIVQWAARHELIDTALSFDAFLKNPTRFDQVISLLGGPDEPSSNHLQSKLGVELTFIDPRPDPQCRLHIVEQWLSEFGEQQSVERHYGEKARRHGGTKARSDKRGLEQRIGSNDRSVVLIHPGSGGLAKCVPIENLAPLVLAFRNAGWTPAWMVGPDERERFGESYDRRLAGISPLIYEESVVVASDLVASADSYVGMDAGMTHVAALAGVNTVALFGPTDPVVWRPLGDAVEVFDFSALTDPVRIVDRILRLKQSSGSP